MDFLEDDPRPRFLLQSGAPSAVADEPDCLIKTSKLHAAACLSSAALLLFSAFYFFLSYQTLSFLLVWVALSLLAAPFAPLSLTGGDITVGRGELIEEAPSDPDPASEEADETTRRGSRRRSRQPRSDAPPPLADQRPIATAGPAAAEKAERRNGSSIHASGASGGRGGAEEKHVFEEKEWTEEDFEILKKQMLKHPVGTTRRWELISEAFGGRHGVESVIRTAKSALDRRHKTADSFQQFLRQRKPLDQRVEGVDGESVTPSGVSVENGDSKGNAANETSSWTSVEDLALLNALKAFPKDVSMRWEKIAAAVPGKSKACCMKRVTELKRDFRSSKASEA